MEHSSQNNPPPQKRLACDRCHLRKLRCLRATSMIECNRCIQLGYVCTYSPPLKPGRPKKTVLTAGETTTPQSRESLASSLDDSSLSSSIDELIGFNDLPLQLNANNNQICFSSQETSSLYHQIDNLSTVWPENTNFNSLESNLTSNHPQCHSIQNKHQSIAGGRTDIECDSGTEESVSYKVQQTASHPRGKTLPEIMCAIARLQQELVQFRSQPDSRWTSPSPSDDTGQVFISPVVGSSFSPVNSILKPSQELIDMTCQIFNECSYFVSGVTHQQQQQPAHLIADRRTLLSLTLTPLTLLLSAYADLLRDLQTAWNRNHKHRCQPCYGSYHPYSISTSASIDMGFLDDGGNQNLQDESHKKSNSIDNAYKISNPECHNIPLVPDNLQLTLGAMVLNRPLQLIMVTTVVKHHLSCLEEALQGANVEISESLFATAIAELRTSVKVLLSEAQSLLHLID